jgi:hypothetical protein
MAKIKVTEAMHIAKPKKKGVAAKTKSSSHKGSKNYVKPYKGQGR